MRIPREVLFGTKRILIAIVGVIVLVTGGYGLLLWQQGKLSNIGGFGLLVELGAVLIILSLYLSDVGNGDETNAADNGLRGWPGRNEQTKRLVVSIIYANSRQPKTQVFSLCRKKI